jgi:predicted GH43/DUF377 family glycosyl hydrolase
MESPRPAFGSGWLFVHSGKVTIGSYVMTYTAFSPRGPRIARAISQDLFHWQRLGLSTFPPYHEET